MTSLICAACGVGYQDPPGPHPPEECMERLKDWETEERRNLTDIRLRIEKATTRIAERDMPGEVIDVNTGAAMPPDPAINMKTGGGVPIGVVGDGMPMPEPPASTDPGAVIKEGGMPPKRADPKSNIATNVTFDMPTHAFERSYRWRPEQAYTSHAPSSDGIRDGLIEWPTFYEPCARCGQQATHTSHDLPYAPQTDMRRWEEQHHA